MYCPKCDMDFVEGVTVCTDCGGPLVDKEQYLKEKAEAKQKAEEDAAAAEKEQEEELDRLMKEANALRAPDIYEKKSDKYEDLKSSSSAFRIVGIALAVFAVISWGNFLNFPVGSNFVLKIALTVLAAGSLFTAWTTDKDARVIKSQIGEEKRTTEQMLAWFMDNYTAEQVDEEARRDAGDLLPEELALKRMNVIQDAYVTNFDLVDQGYVDLLAEEVYSKLFEDGSGSAEADEEDAADDGADGDADAADDAAEGEDTADEEAESGDAAGSDETADTETSGPADETREN